MRKMLLMAALAASLLCGLVSGSSKGQEETGVTAAPVSKGVIKVTITTGGGMYGPVKSQFEVGEDIPVTISMTNTSDRPAKYCISTSLFQNRPQLKRDGQLLPYLTNLPAQVEREQAIQRCEQSASRQFYLLQPRQTRVVDWFKISQMGIRWYKPLPVGHYELVVMRRVECCQGAWLESDKVTFEVVP